MVRATDMQAMRATMVRLNAADFGPLAPKLVHAFTPPDKTVRLAVEIANTGGRATALRGEDIDAVCDLMSSGWLAWWTESRGWELNPRLLAEFAAEVLREDGRRQ